ncbi:MAG: hypothetical protein GY719_27990 [bacterium]|nr:hypothetical protein [bacterium]
MTTTRQRRVLIVAAAVLQLVLFSLLLAWRAGTWHDRGWTGLAFAPGLDLLGDEAAVPEMVRAAEGAVLVVAPGSPAWRAGLVMGDLVLSVDGVDPGEIADLWLLDERKRAGEQIVYEVQTDAGRRRVALALVSPLEAGSTLLGMASSFLTGLAFLGLGLWTCWARPASRGALVFFMMCSAGAALLCLSGAGELDLVDRRGIVPLGLSLDMWGLFAVYLLGSQVLTNLLLHLSLIFPRPRPTLTEWPAVVRWLHTAPFLPFVALPVIAAGQLPRGTLLWAKEVSLAAVAALLVGRLLRDARDSGLRGTLRGHPFTVQLLLLALTAMAAPAARLLPRELLGVAAAFVFLGLLLFLVAVVTVYSVWTCIAFVRGYRESGRTDQQRLRWPLWGAVGSAVGVTVLTTAGAILGFELGDPNAALWASMLSKVLYVPIPLTFVLGILEIRLHEVDVLSRRAAIWATAAAVAVGIGYLLAGTG